MSKVRYLLWPAIVFGVTCVLLAPLFWLAIQIQQPFKGYSQEEKLVQVQRGSTVLAIGDRLEAEGVISSSLLFRTYVYFKNLSTSLKAGQYQFSGSISLEEVVETIAEGRVFYHRITVPEGLDMHEIAEIFVEARFGSLASFLSVMQNGDLIADLDTEACDLEGYLFPETYFVTCGSSELEIIGQMLNKFRGIWTPEYQRRAEELELSVREVITLASLIEKETGLDEERPLVSSVFHNRLRMNMKLACDPTVIYAVKGIKPFDGIIHQSDLELDSPYNTYLYPGLPPGPIANPGKLAIQAALFPAESDYLYFVSRNDGSHLFSKAYRDHAAAVRRYQR